MAKSSQKIKLYRGTRSAIAGSSSKIDAGEVLLDLTDNYLIAGTGADTSVKDATKIITTNRLVGYKGDESTLQASKGAEYGVKYTGSSLAIKAPNGGTSNGEPINLNANSSISGDGDTFTIRHIKARDIRSVNGTDPVDIDKLKSVQTVEGYSVSSGSHTEVYTQVNNVELRRSINTGATPYDRSQVAADWVIANDRVITNKISGFNPATVTPEDFEISSTTGKKIKLNENVEVNSDGDKITVTHKNTSPTPDTVIQIDASTNKITAGTFAGDLTGQADSARTVINGSISTNKIIDQAVTTAKINNNVLSVYSITLKSWPSSVDASQYKVVTLPTIVAPRTTPREFAEKITQNGSLLGKVLKSAPFICSANISTGSTPNHIFPGCFSDDVTFITTTDEESRDISALALTQYRDVSSIVTTPVVVFATTFLLMDPESNGVTITTDTTDQCIYYATFAPGSDYQYKMQCEINWLYDCIHCLD